MARLTLAHGSRTSLSTQRPGNTTDQGGPTRYLHEVIGSAPKNFLG